MAVMLLLDSAVVVCHLDVQDQTAVPALVCMGHILQNHPEVLLCGSKAHPRWHGVGVAVDIPWSHPVLTVLVAMGREKPVVSQVTIGMHESTALGTEQLHCCTVWAGVVHVGSRHRKCGMSMGHVTNHFCNVHQDNAEQ